MAQAPDGWYPDPEGDGSTMRHWTGTEWGDARRKATPAELASGAGSAVSETAPEPATVKDVLWALSLAFGAAGGVIGALSIPIALYYWPLGMGTAGMVLVIAAWSTKGGKAPWFAILAVIGSVLALILGIQAYSDFTDAADALRHL